MFHHKNNGSVEAHPKKCKTKWKPYEFIRPTCNKAVVDVRTVTLPLVGLLKTRCVDKSSSVKTTKATIFLMLHLPNTQTNSKTKEPFYLVTL